MHKRVYLYDATLREGAQSPDTAFSAGDKLTVVRCLDELGVAYIEAGNPGSNPKDEELFRRLAGLRLKTARLAAFGATCRPGANPEEDAGLAALLGAGTPAICLFGKAWDLHVGEVLRTTLAENLRMIRESVAYIKSCGREVIFDAEHFFDGCKENPAFALDCLRAAEQAGADWICLCDTNGGCFPDEVATLTAEARRAVGTPLGIHCHDDTGMAQASTLAAINAGAAQAQVTINGWGERCGNADLFCTAANLQLKLGLNCLPPESMKKLTPMSRYMGELANVSLPRGLPYVGRNAFSHKAGMHIDGVLKLPRSFEHVPPESVGSERRFLLSEVAGRGAVLQRLRRVAPELGKDSPEISRILAAVKQRENEGYRFDGAEASFELMVKKLLGQYKPYFELREFKVMINEPSADDRNATATVRISVGGREDISAADGNGPVNALDKAARRALEAFYPSLREVTLVDYKVRVLDSRDATASTVRVLIESSDGARHWTTVGVSADIINASWQALIDSMEYKLMLDGEATGAAARHGKE